MSSAQITKIIETLASEYKFEVPKAVEFLADQELLPKMMINNLKQKISKGPFDNKKAKEFAEFHNIDIKDIVGTGREGRIKIEDMKKISSNSSSVKVSKAAQKLAEENDIDLSKITPTGIRGDILLKDIKEFIENTPNQPIVIEETVIEEEEPILE